MRLQPYGIPTKELAMGEKPDTVREAVGVFGSANDLQAAIDELLSSGFHRADLSLLANEEAVNEKLGGGFANVRAVEDNPVVPRKAYVSPEAIGDAQGGIVGALCMQAQPLLQAQSSFPAELSLLPSSRQHSSAGREPLSARSWLSGWVITSRSICRRKSIMEACCYGCEPGIPKPKNAQQTS